MKKHSVFLLWLIPVLMGLFLFSGHLEAAAEIPILRRTTPWLFLRPASGFV